MERLDIIEAKGAGKSVESDKSNEATVPLEVIPTTPHAEAVAFVDKHRDFFDHYAKGEVTIRPAPEGLNTFAYNLETGEVYVNSMFYKNLGLSDEKTVFATLHELEHLMEKRQILAEPRTRTQESGERRFAKYLERIKQSRAFSLMDNCVADIHENRTVESKTNEGQKEIEEKIYKEDLFTETDFTSEPRHIQFCNAILRESRLPDEKCTVSPEVRQALDSVAKTTGLMDVMTNPRTPMSTRLRLQDKYIWPKVEALLEKDKEDKKKKKDQENKDQNGESQESKKGEQGKTGQKAGEKGESGKGTGSNKDGKNEPGEIPEDSDPNKVFAADYDKAEKRVPNAVPTKEIEKAFKEWKEIQNGKNDADAADEAYAKKIGVEKEDLRDYRKVVESLEKIVDPETNVGVMEELRDMFSRIISKRIKQAQAPKYPVEDGDELVDPAQLVADVNAGNLQPKVWEDTETRDRKGDRFGEVEITLVGDRSSSMNEGQKAVEQRRSVVMCMEVLKEFADMCDAEKVNVDKPLEVRSEVYSFAISEDDKTPIKKMSKELGEAERILVHKKLYDLPGSTTDFNCLRAISDGLDEDTRRKMKEGELKKIVIVFTDGGSDSPTKVQSVIKSLREAGVIVVGVGMTEAGKPVEATYAPKALVVEDVTKLAVVLSDLLREHLKDL
jgi:hypothetical protein